MGKQSRVMVLATLKLSFVKMSEAICVFTLSFVFTADQPGPGIVKTPRDPLTPLQPHRSPMFSNEQQSDKDKNDWLSLSRFVSGWSHSLTAIKRS